MLKSVLRTQQFEVSPVKLVETEHAHFFTLFGL